MRKNKIKTNNACSEKYTPLYGGKIVSLKTQSKKIKSIEFLDLGKIEINLSLDIRSPIFFAFSRCVICRI